jgi:cytochrome c553
MMAVRGWLAGSLVAGFGLMATQAMAAEPPAHPGKALYERHCAACHDKPDISRAVPLAQLRNMRLGNLFFAMSEGKMKAQAAPLDERQRGQLVDYIVGRQPSAGSMPCAAGSRRARRRPAQPASPGLDSPATTAGR